MKYSKGEGYYFLSGLFHMVLEEWSASSWEDIPEDEILWPYYPDIDIYVPDLGTYELRDYQLDAFYASLERKRGILHLATNAGKTLIAAAITKVLEVPTLFIVHRKTLLQQTYDAFKEHINENELGRVGDGLFEPNKFTIATIQTLANYFKGGKAKAPRKEIADWLKSIGLLFFDECHTTGQGQGLQTVGVNCNAEYRFGLSGTPLYKSELDTFSLIGITGPVIAITTNEELIESGFSSEPIISMIEISGNKQLPKGSKWPKVYENGIVENDKRNDIIISLCQNDKTHNCQNGKPTVVLVKRIKHGKDLTKTLNENNITAVFLCGATPTSERKDVMERLGRDIDVIVATNILEEGVNIPQMQVLILAGGGESKRATLQSIGRILRLSEDGEAELVHVFDFYDDAHDYLINHTINRVNHYLDEKFKVGDGIPETW